MKHIFRTFLVLFVFQVSFGQNQPDKLIPGRIDRRAVVERHKIIAAKTNPKSPAQVGNGEFAFGVDITGLQTFEPYSTMSHWSWHSAPLPTGMQVEDFNGLHMDTHGRMVRYDIPKDEQPELSSWLASNPHRFNLGRIGFVLLKSDGTKALPGDLENPHQEIDMWSGIITSYFELEGKPVTVKTACHPSSDVIGVSVASSLIKSGQVKVFFDFPYPVNGTHDDYNKPDAHSSGIKKIKENTAIIARKLDDTKYFVTLHWTTEAQFLTGDTIASRHRSYLNPVQTDELEFTCSFSPGENGIPAFTPDEVFGESSKSWREYWESGAAIDLSLSRDERWKELERRIVLSQYLMRVNEAGSYPPQESGLVNNGWYGRFHFEMIWWHGVHYALWNRWPLFEKSLHVYADFLPTSVERATNQGYSGARWPKCTANFDRDWPHPIHALLIWQQPHPIYFAELDYRLHPTKETLEKWRDIVFETAEFMADYSYFEKATNRYILGPPMYIVSENTKPETTFNPAFELGYWRFGLRTAQIWKERLGLKRDNKWDDVLLKLSPLPQQDGV